MPLTLFYTIVQKSQKWPKTQIKGGPALTSFFRDLLENMKNNTTFVRMRSGGHRGDAKISKKGISLRRSYVLTNRDRQKRFSQNERGGADLQSHASKSLFFPRI